MKLKIKRLLVVCTSLLIIGASVFSAFADTIYVVNGYSYTIVNNSSIRLVDWDTELNDTLSLPDSIAERYFISVGNWAFENRTDLKGLDLSQAEHLQQIGYEAFIGCSEINTDLILPESLVVLNERSFSDCVSIPNIYINGSLKYIPTECFSGCASTKTVMLPDSLQSIGSWAFGNCAALEYISIPKSVNSIASTAFNNDPNLTLGVWYGSYAYSYAKDNNIPYILLDSVKLGDTDGDGNVSINDVTKVQRYLAELEPLEGIYLHAADANQDGTLDISDATAIQMYLAEYDVPYSIGEVMTQ